ncbi:MAG TPA: S8/S53 family peptidase [Longimicrobium sp.]|nr:S8/S53 family peptidase [Longimicrobium sp.]
MQTRASSREWPAAERPVRDPRALFVRLKRGEEIRAFADSFAEKINAVPRESPLYRYLANHPRAKLTPLYENLGEKVLEEGNWSLVLPQRSARHLSALNHVSVESAAEREWLEAELRRDPLVASFEQPVLQYPVEPVVVNGSAPANDRQWALTTCRFRQVWDVLDVGDDPGTIAVLDQGDNAGHAGLRNRISTPPTTFGTARAVSSHAGEVCSVIAARRDDTDGVDGCCSAMIDLYNVCKPNGDPDSVAYSEALAAVANSNARVLNISLGSAERDANIADQLQRCIDKGIVVVVAMGNQGRQGSPIMFPTAETNVVAVGATNPEDRRPEWASMGEQMFISAPGELIRAVSGAMGFAEPSGTSYSAAIVSAAVWLMRRARPGLEVAQVREILRASADTRFTGGARTAGLGYGRLDMVNLALNVLKIPATPAS